MKSVGKFLSPDSSFINDNYGLNEDLETESTTQFSPPNQFLKDNIAYICISQQICQLPLITRRFQDSQPPQDERKNAAAPLFECQQLESPKATFEASKALEVMSNSYTFKKQNQPKPFGSSGYFLVTAVKNLLRDAQYFRHCD